MRRMGEYARKQIEGRLAAVGELEDARLTAASELSAVQAELAKVDEGGAVVAREALLSSEAEVVRLVGETEALSSEVESARLATASARSTSGVAKRKSPSTARPYTHCAALLMLLEQGSKRSATILCTCSRSAIARLS